MNCDKITRGEIAEKYVLGELSEPDREAFERHYFECSRCFEELQTYRALQLELKRAAPAIRAEPARTRIPWAWTWAPTAAVVLLAVGIGLWFRQHATVPIPVPAPVVRAPKVQASAEPPLPTLQELAQVQPPPYVPTTLRGAEDEAQQRFREAMRHYLKGDYGAAIPGLRRAFELNPKTPEIRFFLGACHLLTGQTDAAIFHLRATVTLGDSPYLEEAHFYLAKAYIRKRILSAARRELISLVELHGEREKEARWLIEQIELLEKTQP